MKSLTSTEIDTVIKNLSITAVSPQIRNCSLVLTKKGRPWAIPGGQCRVYKVTDEKGNYKALRIWNNIINDAEVRCNAISNYISKFSDTYFLDFQYIEKAFKYNSEFYPAILMDWCQGVNLKTYIKKHINDTKTLEKLQVTLLELFAFLHENQISHGDLHHDNIRVEDDGRLFLIDYDSLYVPQLNGYDDECLGYSGYQHPTAREKNRKLSPHADYFSELILYLSIEVIAEKPDMWDVFDIEGRDQSFILEKSDFVSLGTSKAYRTLRELHIKKVSQLLDVLDCYLEKDRIENMFPFQSKVDFLSYLHKSLYCIQCGHQFYNDDMYCCMCGSKRI